MTPLFIKLTWIKGFLNNFEKPQYMYFLMKDKDLLKSMYFLEEDQQYHTKNIDKQSV